MDPRTQTIRLVMMIVGGCLLLTSCSGDVEASKADDSDLATPGATKPAPEPIWLFSRVAGQDAVGASGTQRESSLDGNPSAHSTGFWVGCEDKPAVTTFQLGGEFEGLKGTVLLDTHTPSGLEVEVKFLDDERVLAENRLQKGDQTTLDLDVSGIRALTLTAEATNPDLCVPAEVGYGILHETGLVPTS